MLWQEAHFVANIALPSLDPASARGTVNRETVRRSTRDAMLKHKVKAGFLMVLPLRWCIFSLRSDMMRLYKKTWAFVKIYHKKSYLRGRQKRGVMAGLLGFFLSSIQNLIHTKVDILL
jgi:hypothetical protein